MSSLGKQVEMSASEENEAGFYANLMSSSFVFSMVLNAVDELNVLDIIAKAGPSAHLSPSEIASHIPTNNPDAPLVLDRMLSLLASYSILSCSTRKLEDGRVERLYGIAPAGKFFVSDSNKGSLAPILYLFRHPAMLKAWLNLKVAVLEGGIVFEKVNGRPFFEFMNADSEFKNGFHKGTSASSVMTMDMILKLYRGFEGLNSLVDVGGGKGDTLNKIVTKFPSIKAINFDLPPIIQDAPSYFGIKHVGGDMFAEVPKGDAILLKHVCHNWSDDWCLKLLKNCYIALPDTGKVIVIDTLIPSIPDASGFAKVAYQVDNIMLALHKGKGRVDEEFKALAKDAGFSNFQVVCYAYGIVLIELKK